ncbi:hypothetical protein ANO11243_078340 [Dothideomycetidae sp. 11243]|nr:hypothetical protein ANO11243_078340 [fungal sp. No.11243]
MHGFKRELFNHLVRRGATYSDTPNAYIQTLGDHAAPPEKSPFGDLSSGQIACLLATLTVFFLIYCSISYRIGEVVGSLVMIESPSTVVVTEYQPPKYRDNDAYAPSNAPVDEEIIAIKEKPLTSSITLTTRHLIRLGGWTAPWRGLNAYIVYSILQGIVFTLLSGVFGVIPVIGRFSMFLASVVSTVMLVRLHMTWTHIVISEPSPLRWYRRIPRGRSYFKALATPAAIFAVAQHLTFALPAMVHGSFGPLPTFKDEPVPQSQTQNEVLRLLATLATVLFVGIALLIPAAVTLTRVEASLLPDDAETVVAFDRTLGGAAANLVGFGKINFRALYDAAWRSYDKSSRIRLIKFYAKFIAILILIEIMFTAIMGGMVSYIGMDKISLSVQSLLSQTKQT